jgi:hypothetical protein
MNILNNNTIWRINMLNCKSLLSYLLILAMSFAITACDDCDDEEGGAEAGEEAKADDEEGGSEGGEECPEAGTDETDAGDDAGGDDPGGAEGGEEEANYNHLVLVDDGSSDTVGTSGADVYGLAVSCADGDAALTFESSSFGASASGAACTAGTDCVCTEAVEGQCGGTNRGDTNNILNGSEDAYYSMGNGGHAIFAADMSLDGCSVSFNEVKMDETVSAYACTTAESSPAESADCVAL